MNMIMSKTECDQIEQRFLTNMAAAGPADSAQWAAAYKSLVTARAIRGKAAQLPDISAAVAGALKSAITAHGPITLQSYGSAGKRITNQILASIKTYGLS